MTSQDIAEELFIGKRTAADHMANILGKLLLADRTQAALYALREESATLDEP